MLSPQDQILCQIYSGCWLALDTWSAFFTVDYLDVILSESYLVCLPFQILSKVYLARSDVGFSVRSAAVHVWKTLVTNTPRTLSEILPCLMENIIELLASEGKVVSRPWYLPALPLHKS